MCSCVGDAFGTVRDKGLSGGAIGGVSRARMNDDSRS